MPDTVTITLHDQALRGALQSWLAAQLNLLSVDQVTVAKITKARDGSLSADLVVELPEQALS